MSIVKIDGSEWISGSGLLHGTPARTYRRGRICATLGLWNPAVPLQPHKPLLAAQRAPLRTVNLR